MPPYRDPTALRRARDAGAGPFATAARQTAPEPPDGTVWPAWLAEWWSAVWTSPLTTDWSDVLDLPSVARLAGLYLRLADDAEPNAALLAQVQRLESELGLSPASRRRQHIAPRPVVSPPTTTGQPSARDRLKVGPNGKGGAAA